MLGPGRYSPGTTGASIRKIVFGEEKKKNKTKILTTKTNREPAQCPSCGERCEGSHLQSEHVRSLQLIKKKKKKKTWVFEIPNRLFSKMSASSVPLDLAALRGLLAHGCFLSGLVSRSRQGGLRAGSSLGSIQQRCSQQAPDGAVLPEGVALGAAGGPMVLSHRPLLFLLHTGKKTTSLKMQTREAEELRTPPTPSVRQSVFPTGRGSSPDPDQAGSTSAR